LQSCCVTVEAIVAIQEMLGDKGHPKLYGHSRDKNDGP
jgi:hypothetical protein